MPSQQREWGSPGPGAQPESSPSIVREPRRAAHHGGPLTPLLVGLSLCRCQPSLRVLDLDHPLLHAHAEGPGSPEALLTRTRILWDPGPPFCPPLTEPPPVGPTPQYGHTAALGARDVGFTGTFLQHTSSRPSERLGPGPGSSGEDAAAQSWGRAAGRWGPRNFHPRPREANGPARCPLPQPRLIHSFTHCSFIPSSSQPTQETPAPLNLGHRMKSLCPGKDRNTPLFPQGS